jgi:hypothetical protein
MRRVTKHPALMRSDSSSAYVARVACSHNNHVVHVGSHHSSPNVSDAIEADWFVTEPTSRPCTLLVMGGECPSTVDAR